jgi:hypothetical protein
MAARSRVEINRAALDEIELGLADGVFGIVSAIATRASERAPDATPYGEGLVDKIGGAVWVRARKVAEMTTGSDGRADKPRGLTLKSAGAAIVGFVGAGFPGLFNELGTVRMSAQPFLTPSAMEVLGSQAQIILSSAMARRLQGLRSLNTARIRSRIAARSAS